MPSLKPCCRVKKKIKKNQWFESVKEQLGELATSWKWKPVNLTSFWPVVSLSSSSHRAKHFLSSPWPRFQLRTPQSTTVLAGLTSTLALVACLSPAAADLKLLCSCSCLWMSSSLFPSKALICYTLLVLRQTNASRLLSPCAAWNVISLFSQISFVLPFFCYYLAQSHSCSHSLRKFLQGEDIFYLFPSSPLHLAFCRLLFSIHLVFCPVIIDCSEWLCVAAPVLSYSVRCRLKSIHR